MSSSMFPDDQDLDLDNNPEFLHYLQTQNPTSAMLEYIQEKLKEEIDSGFELYTKAATLAIQKVKDDAAAGRLTCNLENQKAPETAAKTTRGKRSLRNSTFNRAPDTVVRAAHVSKLLVDQATAIKTTVPKQAYVAGLATNNVSDVIPKGKVRIEVFPGPSGESPYAGLVCLVEPLPPKAANARCCKIGRSTGKEFKTYGVSMPKDLEVSTKHGILTRVNKDYFFVDPGSSNGTVDVATDFRLEKLVPYQLENGMMLRIGQSVLKFNFSA